jgi:hypothetical protein
MSVEPDPDSDGLIDISDLTLQELSAWGDSSLLIELRRALGADDDNPDVVAGWSNSV